MKTSISYRRLNDTNKVNTVTMNKETLDNILFEFGDVETYLKTMIHEPFECWIE